MLRLDGVNHVRCLPHHQATGIIPVVIPVEEAIRVHRVMRRRAQPLRPIELARKRRLAQRFLVVQPPRIHQPHLAYAVHELLAFLKQIEAAPLHPDLHHALGPPHGFNHAEAVVNFMRHGLFDVHILAGFHRVDDHLRVPVIRSCDHEGGDRGVVEKPSNVLFDLRLGLLHTRADHGRGAAAVAGDQGGRAPGRPTGRRAGPHGDGHGAAGTPANDARCPATGVAGLHPRVGAP